MELKRSRAIYHDAPVAPAERTFLDQAQDFADEYRRSSSSWHPKFKAEVAKLLAPVVVDLLRSDSNTVLRFLVACGQSCDSWTPAERCDVRRRIGELTRRLEG